MTITISEQAYDELFHQETVERSPHPDPDAPLDVVYRFPRSLGQGCWRSVQLRDGLELEIDEVNRWMREGAIVRRTGYAIALMPIKPPHNPCVLALPVDETLTQYAP